MEEANVLTSVRRQLVDREEHRIAIDQILCMVKEQVINRVMTPNATVEIQTIDRTGASHVRLATCVNDIDVDEAEGMQTTAGKSWKRIVKFPYYIDENDMEKKQSRRERRFQAEARLMHACTPVAPLVYQSHKGYTMMEYIPRENLEQAMERLSGSLDIIKVLAGTEIASALCYVNEKGVAHCDVKPSNILVEGNGNVRIIDFGAAEEIGNKETMDRRRIHATPQYMASELTEHHVTQKTDVYSLGAMLFELFSKSSKTPMQLFAEGIHERTISVDSAEMERVAKRGPVQIDMLKKCTEFWNEMNDARLAVLLKMEIEFQEIASVLFKMLQGESSKRISIHETYDELKTILQNQAEKLKINCKRELLGYAMEGNIYAHDHDPDWRRYIEILKSETQKPIHISETKDMER